MADYVLEGYIWGFIKSLLSRWSGANLDELKTYSKCFYHVEKDLKHP